MTAWWPQSIAESFVGQLLKTDAAVLAELATASDIVANRRPTQVNRRTLTHEMAGGVRNGTAKAQRSILTQVGMYWDITGWEPSASQLSLKPLMEAVMAAMIGDDTRGLTRQATVDGRSFAVMTDYDGPEAVPVEIDPGGAWAPERGRFVIFVSPRD